MRIELIANISEAKNVNPTCSPTKQLYDIKKVAIVHLSGCWASPKTGITPSQTDIPLGRNLLNKTIIGKSNGRYQNAHQTLDTWHRWYLPGPLTLARPWVIIISHGVAAKPNSSKQQQQQQQKGVGWLHNRLIKKINTMKKEEKRKSRKAWAPYRNNFKDNKIYTMDRGMRLESFLLILYFFSSAWRTKFFQ